VFSSNERASHPVGTTVRVADFLKHIPVRRQTALKNASKTITKIKKLLHAYAIAKPSTRLSFKVLKSKTESNNWIYAPKPDANLVHAALKVVGAEIASQCIYREWPSEMHDEGQQIASSPDATVYRLLAFLPMADAGNYTSHLPTDLADTQHADFSGIGNPGQFLSVDGRPVSSSRGTPKEIARLFKTYLRSVAKARGISSSLSDPFLCLYVECPRGSYDVNIEPAKDDILFADPQIVVSLAENLFKDVYGNLSNENRDSGKEVVEKTARKDDFSLSMARKPVIEFPASPPPSNPMGSALQTDLATPGVASTTGASATTAQSDSNSNLRDIGSLSEAQGDTRSSEQNSTNPWTIAKTHFFHQSPKPSGQSRNSICQLVTPICGGDSGKNHIQRNQLLSPSPPFPSPSYTTSPSASSPETQRSPLFVSSNKLPRREDPVPRLEGSLRAARERARERYGNGALDTWFKKTTQSSRDFPPGSCSTVADREDDRVREGSHREILHQTVDPHDSTYTIQPVSGVRKPFKVPIAANRARNSASPDIYSRQLAEDAPLVEPNDKRQEFPVLERWSSLLHQPSPLSQENASDLEDALDFERRKRAAILSRREQMRNGGQSSAPSNSQTTSNSPHHNRYLAARAALATAASTSSAPPDGSAVEAGMAPSLDSNDPRAYFMRHQETDGSNPASGTGLKIKRVHTSRLPLEKVPDGFDTHDLALRLPCALDSLSESYRQAQVTDSYTRSGTKFNAFAAADLASISKIWEARLGELIREKYRARDGDGVPDLQIDLYTAIRSSD
jgi:hypothetical protein